MSETHQFDWVSAGDDQHLGAANRYNEPQARAMSVVASALSLLGSACVDASPPLQYAEANVVSSVACFTRAYRQVRAALLLAHVGYYSEVGLLLRGAYESAGTGQRLAKEPDEADKWLRKNQWWPEKVVRARLRALVERDVADADMDYAAFYRVVSADSHPTAVSTVGLLNVDAVGFRPRLSSQYDEAAFTEMLWRSAAVCVFACFALRNATPDERVLHPEWRRALHECMRVLSQASGKGAEAVAHLDRDWGMERDHWKMIVDRTRRVAGLDDRLRADPLSWTNLVKDDGQIDPDEV